MWFRLLADILVVFHFALIVFVMVGGILAIRWRRAVWVHLPVALWGILIEFWDWPCPLTPLENWLRVRGGQAGYAGGFVEHYILPIIYPPGLTRGVQIVLGASVIAINALIYWYVFARRKRRRPGTRAEASSPRKVCVVVMGDSTTLCQRSPSGQKLTDRVQFHLEQALGHGVVEVINAGAGSETAARGLRRVASVLAYEPDVLTVSYGLNDMFECTDEQFEQALLGIISATRSASTARIILVTSSLLDNNRHLGGIWQNRKGFDQDGYLNSHMLDATRKIAVEQNLPLCDQHALFARLIQGGQHDITELIRADGVHLTPKGNEVAGKHLADAVLRCLSE